MVNSDNTELKKFGDAVREYRKKNKLSQMELSDKASLDRTYIGGIERGERNPSLQNIIKIAQALNINISELFKGF